MTRVVFVIIDALPHRHVGPRVTPTLWGMVHGGGGWAPHGGVAVLASATYPNHATFATGVDPASHGLLANRVLSQGLLRSASEVGPATPTLFDAARAAGRASALVVGDQHLIGVMGGRAADQHWPPDGRLPPGTPLDEHGYAADRAVAAELLPLLHDDLDLVVAHLNEPDTAAHDFGPDSDAALERYRSSDAVLAAVVAALRPRWWDTVLIVVSDHDQVTVTDPEPIDLDAAARRHGAPALVVPEGSAAVVHVDGPDHAAWLAAVPGVSSVRSAGEGRLLALASRGRWFGPGSAPSVLRGVHGGADTRTQVAVVAGGDRCVPALAAALRVAPPPARSWAPTISRLLGLPLGDRRHRAASRSAPPPA